MNRNSVDERAESVSTCGSPSSGAEQGRAHGKDSGASLLTPQHDTACFPGTARGQGLTGPSHPPLRGKGKHVSTREQNRALYV